MKTKILNLIIFIFTILATNSLKSQHVVPEKNDNVITIIAEKDELLNFDNFGKHLINNGYTFASIDRTFKTITTEERVSEGGYKHKLNISFKDSTITIRATCNMLMLGSSIGNYQSTWIDWKYAKSKSNIYNLHYRAFIPVITSYNKPLYYFHKL
jgi:hypothetical protein